MILAAETPLGDGSPPPGWDPFVQRGLLTFVARTRALFTDPAGHRVWFRVTSDPAPGCA